MELQTVTDQLGRTVQIPKSPQRIVSLVPSQTELLYDLGLDDHVVGITKFCVHPESWFRNKTRVGGTKQLHLNKIAELEPDLIIANKEENHKEDIEHLSKDFPVWVSDVSNLDSALEMIYSISKITDADATEILSEIKFQFSALQPIRPSLKALYLIWKDPYMAVGSDTFISDMMQRCGFENALTETRYPELTESDIAELKPELILLSSEPFPFKDEHIEELKELLPKTEMRLVDGEMFSWYGSRLKLACSYLSKLIASIGK